MKKTNIIVWIFLFSGFVLNAQVPAGFNYQAIVRNTNGGVINDQEVTLRTSIIEETNLGQTIVYTEKHATSTNSFGQVSLVIGSGTPVLGTFSNIDWSRNKFFLKVEVDPAGGDNFKSIGTSQLLSVPFAMHAKTVEAREVVGDPKANPEDPIFVVRNTEGQVVFAVYNQGVRVYVDNSSTKAAAKRGGFAVGGIRAEKSMEETEFFRVTPDSVRVWLHNTGTKDGLKAAAKRGGFAVGGIRAEKSTQPYDYYLEVSQENTAEIINPSEPRILWYPKKEAFLTGSVLIEHPDSVGTNSFSTGFESKAIGNYSQALGFKSRALGANSFAIGSNAVAKSNSSFAFGDGALAINEGAYAFGSIPVDSTGTVIGNGKATTAEGANSFALGMGAYSKGKSSIALGTLAHAMGNESYAMGKGAVALGEQSFAIGSFGKDINNNLTGNTVAGGTSSFAIGLGARSSGEASFALGLKSQSSGKFSNTLGYYAEASGVNSTAIGNQPVASGANSFAFGYKALSEGSSSFAFGVNAKATGQNSIAMGELSHASNDYSIAIGNENITNGFGAITFGSKNYAERGGGIAIGNGNVVESAQSILIGSNLLSRSYGTFIFGTANEWKPEWDADGWNTKAPIFVIGNGNIAFEEERSNALVIYKDGNAAFNKAVFTRKGLIQVHAPADISDSQPLEEGVDQLKSIKANRNLMNDGSESNAIDIATLKEVFPAAVIQSPDGTVEGVNYSELIPVLLNAIKQLEDRVATLESKVQ
jgi:hypothetical protein